MKFKLWQWEYEFDKEDAEIVIPLVLLVLGLAFTPLNKAALWLGGAAYYLLFFFGKKCVVGLRKIQHWRSFRCPYCKSHDVVRTGFPGISRRYSVYVASLQSLWRNLDLAQQW